MNMRLRVQREWGCDQFHRYRCSLTKELSIRETIRMQFRAEAFNLTKCRRLRRRIPASVRQRSMRSRSRPRFLTHACCNLL